MLKNKNIQIIKTSPLKWVNLSNNSQKELDWLKNNFKFHPLDLKDCLPPARRSKLDEYENYFFLALTFPFYDRKNREIVTEETDFFIGPGFLVSVHNNAIPAIGKFFDQCASTDTLRQKYLDRGAFFLFSEILSRLQNYLYPILDHLNEDIENLKKKIFTGSEKNMVKEILLIRRNIISFRKAIQTHKNIVKKLIGKNDRFFVPSAVHVYLNNNLEQTKDIWDVLEGLNEYINALHSTNASLISFKLNDIMRILTIVSVNLFSLTLIAAIFAIKTKELEFVRNEYGLLAVFGLMLVTALSITAYFKRKDWL